MHHFIIVLEFQFGNSDLKLRPLVKPKIKPEKIYMHVNVSITQCYIMIFKRNYKTSLYQWNKRLNVHQ